MKWFIHLWAWLCAALAVANVVLIGVHLYQGRWPLAALSVAAAWLGFYAHRALLQSV